MIQGISKKQTRTGPLEKNLILLQGGHYDSYFISVMCLKALPSQGYSTLSS